MMWTFLLSTCVMASATVPGTGPTALFHKPLFPGRNRRADASGFHRGDPNSSPELFLLGAQGSLTLFNKPLVTRLTTRTTTIFAATTTTKDDSVDSEFVPTRKPTGLDEDTPSRGNYLPKATAQRDTGTPAVVDMSSNTTSIPSSAMYSLNNTTPALENVSDDVVTSEDAATKRQNHGTTSEIATPTEILPAAPMNITNLHETATNTPRDMPKNTEIEPKYYEDDVATVQGVSRLPSSDPCEILEIRINASDPIAACIQIQLIVADDKCKEPSHDWNLQLRDRASGNIKYFISMSEVERFQNYDMLEGEYEVTDGQLTSVPFRLAYTKYIPQTAISSPDDRIVVSLKPSEFMDELKYEVKACPCETRNNDCINAAGNNELEFSISKELCTAPECSYRFEVIVYRRSCPGMPDETYIVDIEKIENDTCFHYSNFNITDDGSLVRTLTTPMNITSTVLTSVLCVLGFLLMVITTLRLRTKAMKLMASGVRAAPLERAHAKLQHKVEVLLVYRKWIIDPRVIEALIRTLEDHYNCQVNDLYDLRDPTKLFDGHGWIERKIKTSSVRCLFVAETARSISPDPDDLVECFLNSSLRFENRGLTREDQWYLFVLRCLRDTHLIYDYERVFVASFHMAGTDIRDVKSIFEATGDKQEVRGNSPNDGDILNPMKSKDALWFLVPNMRYDLRQHMGFLGQTLQMKTDMII